MVDPLWGPLVVAVSGLAARWVSERWRLRGLARVLEAPAPPALQDALGTPDPEALIRQVHPTVPIVPGRRTGYDPHRHVIRWAPDARFAPWVAGFEALHEAWHARTQALLLAAWLPAAVIIAVGVAASGMVPGLLPVEVWTAGVGLLAGWRYYAEHLADARALATTCSRLDASTAQWLARWVRWRRPWNAWDAFMAGVIWPSVGLLIVALAPLMGIRA